MVSATGQSEISSSVDRDNDQQLYQKLVGCSNEGRIDIFGVVRNVLIDSRLLDRPALKSLSTSGHFTVADPYLSDSNTENCPLPAYGITLIVQ